jgi:hypothetical protein
MNKSDIHPMPQFFDTYINMVSEENLMEALQHSMDALTNFDKNVFENIGDRKYQTNKWTTKEVLQHIIDNERVQAYRALRIARRDQTPLPGYDEELFGQNAKTVHRTIEDMIDELRTVRLTTIQLFKSFEVSDLAQKGICFNQNISVLALGFVIVGHQIHHINVIKERYFPLYSIESII